MALAVVLVLVVVRHANQWTSDLAPAADVGSDHWTTGDKDAIGTAFGTQSNVWFTATHGTLADLLYPTVDVDNLRQLAYLVTDGSTFFFDSSTQGFASSRVTDDRALTYELRVEDPDHHFALVTQIASDPSAPVVQVHTQLVGDASKLHVYAYLVPHLGGSGAGQTAFFDGDRAYVVKNKIWLAISGPMAVRTAGFLGHGDGYDQLHQHVLANRYREAGPGRVTLTWELPPGGSWTTALAFGFSRHPADAALDGTLKRGFRSVSDAFRDGWRGYASSLRPPPGASPLFYYSAQVIKMAEDKLHPGAIVASLALPWGDTGADDQPDTGYRKVWPRDLYHAASALLAAGDEATASDVLRFMGRMQQPDGSMPQNTNLEGRPVWTAQQLDETADAILLAVRLSGKAEGPDIEKAVSYLVANGPATQQERWEEASGYSPATIAAEIAAVEATMRWEVKTGLIVDRAVPLRDIVTRWNQNLEGETFTHTGPLGPAYYMRISVDGKPDTAEPINLANGGGVWDQREIVDPSFLELVRLGVRPPRDPRITATEAIVDTSSSGQVAGKMLWHRYPHDGYGEKNEGSGAPGQGHLWPLLSGERGVYTVMAGGDGRPYESELETLAGTDGLLGEQVWEGSGLPTGSACPLVWAHAEYIILVKAVATGVVDDYPAGWPAA